MSLIKIIVVENDEVVYSNHKYLLWFDDGPNRNAEHLQQF